MIVTSPYQREFLKFALDLIVHHNISCDLTDMNSRIPILSLLIDRPLNWEKMFDKFLPLTTNIDASDDSNISPFLQCFVLEDY